MNDKDFQSATRTSNLEQCLMSFCKKKYLNKPCQVCGLVGNFTRIVDNDLYNYDADNYIILNNKYYQDFKHNKDKYIKYFTKEQKEFYFSYSQDKKYYSQKEKYNYNLLLFKKYFGFEYNDNVKKKTKNLFFQPSKQIREILKETTMEKGAGMFNKTLIRDNFDNKTNEFIINGE